MAAQSVVYVIAKAPQPRTCKTRLCPPLSTGQAVDLARAFLLDAVEIGRRSGLAVRVMCRSGSERELLLTLLESDVSVSVQRGRGLGSALESAFAEGKADGFDVVGVFGADSPTLHPGILRSAFAAVEQGTDVALGPSADGGYYLLVARDPHPPLFRHMPWGKNNIAQLTLQRCESLRLSTQQLPVWYDVDDWAGLAQLREEVARAAPEVARHTRNQLRLAELEVSRAPAEPLSPGRLIPNGAA